MYYGSLGASSAGQPRSVGLLGEGHYPAASWTHIYTDGSAENATRNGGCGAYIKRPGQHPLSVSAPVGILCSNYRAEVLALLNATEIIISWEEKPKKAVFLTDSLLALQALMSGEPDTTQKKLTENTNTLAQTTFVVLQWIPAHIGIWGNEMADELAKEGREKEQPPSHLSYREVKTLIHNKKESHLPLQDWRKQPKPGRTPSAATTPTDHHLSPQNRPLQTE